METSFSWIQSIQEKATKRTVEIVQNLGKNRLWQRQLKNITTTTILGMLIFG